MEHWINSKVLVAVSGGPDSVVVLRLLKLIQQQSPGTGDLLVAHCNHGTRLNCELDAAFVLDLAKKLGFKSYQIDRHGIDDDSRTCSESEDSLREFRYQSFLKLAGDVGARYVVTGHNADDQIETILFRLVRGSGISGLKGTPVVRTLAGVSIVRPLLTTNRNEIVSALKELGQDVRIDESNASLKYSRNFLRHEVIPKLYEKFGEQFGDSIKRISIQAGEFDQFMDQMAEPFADKLKMIAEGGDSMLVASLDVSELCNQHLVLVRHVAKLVWRKLELPEQAMSWEKWNLISKLIIEKGDAPVQLPGNVTLRQVDGWIRFETTPTIKSRRK